MDIKLINIGFGNIVSAKYDIFDDSFTNQPYPIGNDIIECHYIYFKYVYDNNKNIIDLSNFQTSL